MALNLVLCVFRSRQAWISIAADDTTIFDAIGIYGFLGKLFGAALCRLSLISLQRMFDAMAFFVAILALNCHVCFICMFFY